MLRPHQTIAEVAADEPAGAFAVGAFRDGELIAVGMIARQGEPGAWRVRAMATMPSLRGQGAGGAVLSALMAHARDEGALRVWCHARTPARSLYERFGFRALSEEFTLPEIGPHLLMEWRLVSHRTAAPSTKAA